VEPDEEDRRPAHDPGCYLCPGNVRAGGMHNPHYTRPWVFDNDFPALMTDASAGAGASGESTGPVPTTPGPDDLLTARAAGGVCRVVCFSPRHDLTLAQMTPAAIRLVVDAWAAEVATLGARDDIRYVQVFENKGAAMGCSNPHPHGQVWATDHIPLLPGRKLATQRRYYDAHGRDLLGDYLARELDARHRIVCSNEHWVALVPFWAVWPFETMVVPRERVADLPSLDEGQRDALASIVGELTARYDNLFRCSFPYSMGWHGRPTDGGDHPWWRLHAVFLPPLLRSATIRKFLVGYELTAEPQRDLTPELAAERLRATDAAHYRAPSGG
jgi:UDPglucose--hexose-1-phosphate uridylyltransferase